MDEGTKFIKTKFLNLHFTILPSVFLFIRRDTWRTISILESVCYVNMVSLAEKIYLIDTLIDIRFKILHLVYSGNQIPYESSSILQGIPLQKQIGTT